MPSLCSYPEGKKEEIGVIRNGKVIFVGYHSITERIWKISDPVECKVREATSVEFDESVSITTEVKHC